MLKLNKWLLISAVLTSVVFLFIVESFNDLTLDDVGFALILQKGDIWNFIAGMYMTWQGRFMGFLVTGVQLKSYFLFGSMMPFSALLYILNVLLVSESLVSLFKIGRIQGMIYAVVFFQLYVYSMLDISSYFWLCTKGYTLMITLGLFGFSQITDNNRTGWSQYILLLITFAFLGCSYEIFAPLILLLMVGMLLYRLIKTGYNFKTLLTENGKLIFSICVCLLFFLLMVIAPGNWIRMKANTGASDLLFKDFIFAASKNSIHLTKLLVLKAHYFAAAGILLWAVSQRKTSAESIEKPLALNKILLYAIISISLCLVSILLNTYATGARVALRALNHINLICFIFIGLVLYEFASCRRLEKFFISVVPVTLLFITLCNIYSSIRSIPELRAYKASVNDRIENLGMLTARTNRETVRLARLYVPEFHSVDDLWKKVIPKFTPQVLLKPNEISKDTSNFYNKSYREYYKLNFNVTTDLSYGL